MLLVFPHNFLVPRNILILPFIRFTFSLVVHFRDELTSRIESYATIDCLIPVAPIILVNSESNSFNRRLWKIKWLTIDSLECLTSVSIKPFCVYQCLAIRVPEVKVNMCKFVSASNINSYGSKLESSDFMDAFISWFWPFMPFSFFDSIWTIVSTKRRQIDDFPLLDKCTQLTNVHNAVGPCRVR